MDQNSSPDDPGFKGSDIDIINLANPRAVINLVCPEVEKTIRSLPKYYFELTEKEARNKFRPSPVMNQLRAAFWVEYNRVQLEQRDKMDMVRIYSGVVSKQFFYNRVARSMEFVAWMILPPHSYEGMLNEGRNAYFGRLRDFLDDDALTQEGKLSTRHLNMVFKIWQALHATHKGAVSFSKPPLIKPDEVQNIMHEKVANVGRQDTIEKMKDLRAKLRESGAPSVVSIQAEGGSDDEAV